MEFCADEVYKICRPWLVLIKIFQNITFVRRLGAFFSQDVVSCEIRTEVKDRASIIETDFTFTNIGKQLENVEYFNYLCNLLKNK
jgi:hypothetical protein